MARADRRAGLEGKEPQLEAKHRPIDVVGWAHTDSWSNPISVWTNKELNERQNDAYSCWSSKVVVAEPLGFCEGYEDDPQVALDVPDEFYAFRCLPGSAPDARDMGDVFCYSIAMLCEDPALADLGDAAAARSGRMWAEAVRDYSDLGIGR